MRFIGANLTGARFEGANIAATDFADARLDGANFRTAQLRGVGLSNASVTGVDWFLAQYDCQTRFPDGFDPLHAGMLPIDRSCTPQGVRLVFDSRTLPTANLQDVDLRGASFRRARFSFTRLWNANLAAADMSGSSTENVSFSGANLTNADFTNARTLGTFHGEPEHNHPARLDGAIFRGAVFEVRNFYHGDETGAVDLSGTYLEGAILLCLSVLEAQPGEWRDLQIAWIRALEPRRRGVILGDGCDRIPELRDLR